MRHVNPDEAVAAGACVAAGMKARNQQLEEIVLTDVCPHTLGVETSREITPEKFEEGLFSPIIDRNSTVPVSRVERYYPVRDGQREVQFTIYQGESPMVSGTSGRQHLGAGPSQAPGREPRRRPFHLDINDCCRSRPRRSRPASPARSSWSGIRACWSRRDPQEAGGARGMKIHRVTSRRTSPSSRAGASVREMLWARRPQDALDRFRHAMAARTALIAEHREQFGSFPTTSNARASVSPFHHLGLARMRANARSSALREGAQITVPTRIVAFRR